MKKTPVVVVEPSPICRKLMDAMLRKLGYGDVTVTPNAAGLGNLRNSVVFVNAGEDLSDKLRASQMLVGVCPLSARPDDPRFDFCLPKPVRIEALRKVLAPRLNGCLARKYAAEYDDDESEKPSCAPAAGAANR